MRGKMLLQCPMESREGSIVALGPKDSHLFIACWTSAIRFFGTLPIAGPAMAANAGFGSFNPSGRSSIPFVANAASSSTLSLQGPESH